MAVAIFRWSRDPTGRKPDLCFGRVNDVQLRMKLRQVGLTKYGLERVISAAPGRRHFFETHHGGIA
jgi:hypothetical protein